ncbi:3'-5' exonuclease [Actinomadura xylanilytica]|uniref:3'-5' exonuclease n=1 Tax=Actinomadura xylanilytica TaxID=887459 RepID=UPI00255A7135|nr:3'-5' exonuclease [Actinomadura xylanilytica]MDL4774544.1 3'-5' exonuclease [Actinomadura xylanilytica]
MRILASVLPTPQQLTILGDSGPGYRVIRGAAGSGKTTTALLRLKQLKRSRLARRLRLGEEAPVRMLVLTFNRTLAGYVKELTREQEQDSGLKLEVSTFSKWARGLAREIDILDREDAGPILRRLLAGIARDDRPIDFLVDEVEYALSRFPREDLSDYVGAARTGRGRSPRVDAQLRKRLLTEVIEPYHQEKERQGRHDWNDLALLAGAAPGPLYDVVIVDEAQDFSANQIRALRSHLAPDHSTTFVLDSVQRIYAPHFTWAEVGISLRPQQIHMLHHNKRNTREIAAFAGSLVSDLPMEDDGALPDFTQCTATGPRPKIVAGRFGAQIDHMLDDVLTRADLAEESIAVLHPRGGGWFNHVRGELVRRGVAFCELTGTSLWPAGPENVALSTIHSAKGLEFDHVLIPGLSRQITPHGTGDGDGSLDQLKRLLAMGIGRARRSVMLGYKPGEESTLIGLFEPATYDLVQV